MPTTSEPILNDAETLEMLIAFYAEALHFLEVPEELWAELKVGFPIDSSSGKANIVSINYAKRRIIVCLQFFRVMTQTSPHTAGDTPTVYRNLGYKLARHWQQYLKTGVSQVFEKDKDCCDFAMALGIIKGLPQIDAPVDEQYIQVLGFNPFDREAAIRLLREEFGLDCKEIQAFDLANKEKRTLVTLTDKDRTRRDADLIKLYEESISLQLPKIEDGQLGSHSNPFPNVDEAADYILHIEKQRLSADPYRQAIDKEQYYFDSEGGYFRISWASPHVSYYPIEGATSSDFVVNQLSQRPGHYGELPRFSIKPLLCHNKFLFRGQSQSYPKCVPNMFRDTAKVANHQYVDDVIQINEMEVLLQQHPLVQLFEQGFYLLHEFFQIRIGKTI